MAIIDLSYDPAAFARGDFKKYMPVVIRCSIYDNGTLTLLLNLTSDNILNMTKQIVYQFIEISGYQERLDNLSLELDQIIIPT